MTESLFDVVSLCDGDIEMEQGCRLWCWGRWSSCKEMRIELSSSSDLGGGDKGRQLAAAEGHLALAAAPMTKKKNIPTL